MDIAVCVLVFLVGINCGWLLNRHRELIARRANTMQPVVLPPDAASDLSLGRSADRESLAKLKIVVDAEVCAVVKLAPYSENARHLVELVGNRIFKEVAVRLGPEPSESQDAMEKV